MIINFHPSGAETTSGASDSFYRPDMALSALFVNVTDVQGILPYLTVRLQHSPNNTDWYNFGNIATSGIAAVGSYSSSPAALGLLTDYVRITWTITGTNPSFTFTADVGAKAT